MLKTNYLYLLIVITVILMECATPRDIPSNYLVNPRNMNIMTHGCWISIDTSITNDEATSSIISGELIAVQNDTFYILTPVVLVAVPAKELRTANLFMFKDQTNKYLLATGIGLIPNVIGVFVGNPVSILGIPFAIVGATTALIENSANRLRFPKKNKLNEFNKFARFPQGIPSGVGLNELTLNLSAL